MDSLLYISPVSKHASIVDCASIDLQTIARYLFSPRYYHETIMVFPNRHILVLLTMWCVSKVADADYKIRFKHSYRDNESVWKSSITKYKHPNIM